MAKPLESKKDVMISIRIDEETLAMVDDVVLRERRTTRTNAIRALIGEALDARRAQQHHRRLAGAAK